jgi:ABC-type nitrate/sulfonate/bicarbonate transport system permease component
MTETVRYLDVLRLGFATAALRGSAELRLPANMPFVFTGGAIGIFLQWLHRRHKTGGSGG